MEIGFNVIGSVLIGILVGFIANKLSGENKLGLFTSFAIGMVGTLTGAFILNLCRINYDSVSSAVLTSYVVSAFMAAVFLYIAVQTNKNHQEN